MLVFTSFGSLFSNLPRLIISFICPLHAFFRGQTELVHTLYCKKALLTLNEVFDFSCDAGQEVYYFLIYQMKDLDIIFSEISLNLKVSILDIYD